MSDYQKWRDAKVNPYSRIFYRHIDDLGYIVWRIGTGDNVELLHIHTIEKGKGYGRKLFYMMLDDLQACPPYHSIFGFTRVLNDDAMAFYGALGFELQEIRGLYRDGRAILFTQSYTRLLYMKADYEREIGG